MQKSTSKDLPVGGTSLPSGPFIGPVIVPVRCAIEQVQSPDAISTLMDDCPSAGLGRYERSQVPLVYAPLLHEWVVDRANARPYQLCCVARRSPGPAHSTHHPTSASVSCSLVQWVSWTDIIPALRLFLCATIDYELDDAGGPERVHRFFAVRSLLLLRRLRTSCASWFVPPGICAFDRTAKVLAWEREVSCAN